MMTKKPFKLLAASDLHGNSRACKKLAERAEKESVDLVVLCGDLTGFHETNDIIKPFKDKGQKVLILPGNWDTFATTDFLAKMYGVTNIHGYSAQYEHVGFFGAGSSSKVVGPASTITEEELKDTLKRAHEGLGKGIEKKVMLTHMHPAGGVTEKIAGEGLGSDSIREAIKTFKPDLLIHGHIHETFGIEDELDGVRVLNAGPEGHVIEL